MSFTGFHHKQETRKRMRAARLFLRLYKCGMGEIELTMTQVTAITNALRKIMPDMKQIEVKGEIKHRHIEEMTSEELARQLADVEAELARSRVDAAPGPRNEPSIH